MKNKFLLMAVISALAALVIVPSTMAATGDETDVSASITSGEFLLTAHGAFAESSIGLGSAPRSINAQTVSAVQDFSATSLNYFRLLDYVADGGANVSVALNKDFEYSGTASASFDISGTNLDIIPFFDGGSPVAPTCADDWSTSCQLMTASSSSQVAATDFTFAAEYSTGVAPAVTGTTADYVTTDTPYPYVLRFGMEKLKLTIPADAVNGTYNSTLYILASGI